MLTPVDLTDFFWAKMVMFTQDSDFGQNGDVDRQDLGFQQESVDL